MNLYEEEDLKAYPRINQVYKITRSFPEGGTVDLEITPNFEPSIYFYFPLKREKRQTKLKGGKGAMGKNI